MGKTYKPVIKPGTHLASSKGTRGAMRGTLLDNKTNKIVGQAEWKEVSSTGSLLEKAVVAGTIAAGSTLAKKVLDSHIAESLEKGKKETQQSEQAHTKSVSERNQPTKAQIKQEIKLEEFRQKELRKSEKRVERQQIREEKRERQKEAVKNAAASGAIHLAKGLRFLLKHLFLALFWCLKQLFFALYRLAKWGINKISVSIQQKKSVQQTSNCPDIVNTESVSSLAYTPSNYTTMVDEAVNNFQCNMSSEEAQMRLLKILALSIELAQEVREFINKSTEDTEMLETEKLQWQQALGKLSTEKAVEYVNSALAHQYRQLESDTLNVIAINLYDGNMERLATEPLCQEQVKAVLQVDLTN